MTVGPPVVPACTKYGATLMNHLSSWTQVGTKRGSLCVGLKLKGPSLSSQRKVVFPCGLYQQLLLDTCGSAQLSDDVVLLAHYRCLGKQHFFFTGP